MQARRPALTSTTPATRCADAIVKDALQLDEHVAQLHAAEAAALDQYPKIDVGNSEPGP